MFLRLAALFRCLGVIDETVVRAEKRDDQAIICVFYVIWAVISLYADCDSREISGELHVEAIN